MTPRASTFGQALCCSVDDYHRMGATPTLRPALRTELIDGAVVDLSPNGHPHADTVKPLSNLLKQHLGPSAIVSVHDPV